MRLRVSDSLSRIVLLLSAIVLLGAGVALRSGSRADFRGRDDFAAGMAQRAERVRPKWLVNELRSEISSKYHMARRDRALGMLLISTGLVAIVVVALSGRGASDSRASV